MNERGYRNSVHERVKQKMLTEINPGVARGSTTLINACILVQPSTMAHSSISLGILAK